MLIITNFERMRFLTLLLLYISLLSCGNAQEKNNSKKMEYPYTNALINESSPYLLQHAHNPVNWMPWNAETLQKAKDENKPLLISIGYSACHWCHVMEHESFEDTAVAEIMNKNFICIKIDREERPDIDQVYMNAVQLMTNRGGWPLNCFATPDGRPFYGGTYFPKAGWVDVLNQLSDLYQNNPEKVNEYANQLTAGVKASELIQRNTDEISVSMNLFAEGLTKWQSSFDKKYGGNNQAPKFPIPSNYDFLLRYYYHTKDEEIKQHLLLTLEKMAYGGIYDQIGGGFARYSTDKEWKVPHFEKMLYDNAQLIELYSKAYQLEKNPLYKQVVYESIQFVKEELTAKNGAFFSALDADSEGEEGKYYVWKKKELEEVLGKGDDLKLAEAYFNINAYGFWEHNNYVLIRDKSNDELAKKAKLNLQKYETRIKSIKLKLKKERTKRIKPGLDDKSLSSWNALMTKALAEAYLTFREKEFLNTAIKNANFILEKQVQPNGALWHSYKDGKSSINAYLEDYCFTIEAFIKLYEATLDEQWLFEAKKLLDYSIAHFHDVESGMFFFTDKDDPKLIARKMEVSDNVIPASNSSIALALFRLGKYFDDDHYVNISRQMLTNIGPQMNSYLPGYSNWAVLLMNNSRPFYEVAIVGKESEEKVFELYQHYLPNKMIIGSNHSENQLSLLENKFIDGQTTIYVCENKVCQLPVTSVQNALKQMLP